MFRSSFSRLFSSRPSTNCYDVVISGGGMVGTSIACALAKSPYFANRKILLIEAGKKQDWSQPPPAIYSNRVSALSSGSKAFLEELGCWEDIVTSRHKKVKHLHVWEATSNSFINLSKDNDNDDMVYIVENKVIIGALLKCIETDLSGKVDFIYGKRLGNCLLPDKTAVIKPLVELDIDDKKYHSSLLIGADGPNSLVRKTAGFDYFKLDYEQKAVVATLNFTNIGENNTAWQKFLPSGDVLALLPLTNTSSSLVWCTSAHNAHYLVQSEEDEFVDSINKALWDDSSKIKMVDKILNSTDQCLKALFPSKGFTNQQLPPSITGVDLKSRSHFPITLGHAVQYVSSRVALAGDSAHTVHPLAGQGVNIGFRDVKILVDVLNVSVAKGEELGNLFSLLEYERKTQYFAVATMFSIHMIHTLTKTNLLPVAVARAMTAQLVNAANPLKQQIIKFASN